MSKVTVVLSGCGFMDGAEIHESTLTLLALDQAKVAVNCCAPNIEQAAVIDHLSGKIAGGQSRHVLIESARIARGRIHDIAQVQASDLDALIFPGGFGAAKNLCNFADKGADCDVHPEVERLIGDVLDAGKPIGVICIAPAMLARVLGKRGLKPKLTIGNDRETAAAIEQMGPQHVDCPVDSVVVDEQHRIVSTPAYMLAKGPAEVYEGIRKLVNELLKMAG